MKEDLQRVDYSRRCDESVELVISENALRGGGAGSGNLAKGQIRVVTCGGFAASCQKSFRDSF